MPKLPDLHNLSGDPEHLNFSRADPRRIEQKRQEHTEMIESLPAGSLSGGEVIPDISDPGTWYAFANSEDEGDRKLARFAEEYLGVSAENANEGLSRREKDALYKASEQELNGITAESLRKQDREDARFNKAAEIMWPEYVLKFPEAAADPQGAQEAISRLIEGSSLDRGQLAQLAEDPRTREDLLWQIYSEQVQPGSVTQNRPQAPVQQSYEPQQDYYQQPEYQQNYAHRTGGTGGGTRRVSTGRVREDDGPMTTASIIRQLQKRGGWHS